MSALYIAGGVVSGTLMVIWVAVAYSICKQVNARLPRPQYSWWDGSGVYKALPHHRAFYPQSRLRLAFWAIVAGLIVLGLAALPYQLKTIR